MAEVNRTPLNTIPHKWAFDREIEPWLRLLLKQIDQLRFRTGGDSDYIYETQADVADSESILNYDIRQLRDQQDKNLAESQTTRKVRRLEAEIQALTAETQTQHRQLSTLSATLNQLIAELQTNA